MSGTVSAHLAGALLLGFFVSAAAGKALIPFLRRIKAQQTERDDGPRSHLKKSGTPNMGGLMILLGFLTAGGLFAVRYRQILPVLLLTAGFGAVGFADDFLKDRNHRSMGLRAWQKLALQLLFAGLFAWYIERVHGISLLMKVPFLAGTELDFAWLNVPIFLFVVVATVNGTNLTDGIDGLAGSVTAVAALFFTAAALLIGGQEVYQGMADGGVAPAGAAMLGALLGFLLYNAYPAKIFMGDTGSLALGGFVAGMAYMLQLPLFIPIVGFVYMAEVVSVILQVLYFKKTHGKRLFRMAPLHHHFELGGWSETRIVAVFTIVTILLCAAALPGVW